jgi:RNA polymerase sigma-70 factor (ECF subfamily)
VSLVASDNFNTSLVKRAVGGERLATEQLLMGIYDRLASRLAREIPSDLREILSVEDVISQTFGEALRGIGSFKGGSVESFACWIIKTSENLLRNLIKYHRRQMRDQRKIKVRGLGVRPSVDRLLDLLLVGKDTPSRSVARDEAIKAVQIALTQLEPEHREIMHLRYIVDTPVKEIAASVGRTERAIHGVCNRSLKRLREILGNRSRFLSYKG